MSDISVEQQLDGTFRVVVRQGKRSTTHVVSVSDSTREELGCPDVTVDELMARVVRIPPRARTVVVDPATLSSHADRGLLP